MATDDPTTAAALIVAGLKKAGTDVAFGENPLDRRRL